MEKEILQSMLNKTIESAEYLEKITKKIGKIPETMDDTDNTEILKEILKENKKEYQINIKLNIL